jgi:hypothetical protein
MLLSITALLRLCYWYHQCLHIHNHPMSKFYDKVNEIKEKLGKRVITKARYYRLPILSDYGSDIIQYYNDLQPVLSAVKQGKVPKGIIDTLIEPVSNIKKFLQYYGNSALFQSFLYPYFSKETTSTGNFDVLVTLFNYIHDCCKQVDITLRITLPIPIKVPIFSWNKIPQQGRDELLTSLKEVFDLEEGEGESIDDARIKKIDGGNTISVTASKIRILIKLDLEKKKAIAIIDSTNRKT